MARKFLVSLDLNKNELQNARLQNLAASPATPVLGQFYYDSVLGHGYICTNATGPVWEAMAGVTAFATPAIALGVAAAAGAASTVIRSDATIAAFDATAPSTQAFGDAAAVGVAAFATRRDHKHAMPSERVAASTTPAAVGTAAVGVGVTDARADHVHATGAATPSTQAFADAAAIGTGPAASMTDHKHAMMTHLTADHAAVSISGLSVPTADVPWNAKKITGLLDPTGLQDAATKNYVDNAINGLDWKASVRVATTAQGAIATAFANTQVVDGITLATNDRILLKAQTAGAENGIYIVQAAGAPVRSLDADANSEVTPGMAVFVEEGTTNADTAWTMTNNGAIVLGTTALVFAQFTSLGQITAGAGLTKTGNSLDVVAGATIGTGGPGGGLVVNADDVVIDKAIVVRKFAVSIGDGTTTALTVTHNLGTLDVEVQVYDISTGATVEPDIVRATTNTCTITFATAPTTNQFRCLVQG